MPIYEYVCTSCGHTLEVFQGIKDDPLVDCANCQSSSLVKLVSASLFRLKGGGWYETDFKKDSDKKKNLINNESAPTTTTAASSGTAANNHSAASTSKSPVDSI